MPFENLIPTSVMNLLYHLSSKSKSLKSLCVKGVTLPFQGHFLLASLLPTILTHSGKNLSHLPLSVSLLTLSFRLLDVSN